MERKIAVIGLGYVGLAVAVTFAKKYKVIGFDIDLHRVQQLKKGKDKNREISAAELAEVKITFTANPEELKKANFYIITVPTPVDDSKRPDFSFLQAASKIVGRFLKKGDIVVYESTVYPGATEEICIPYLKAASGLADGKDFLVGYSPERIDPGNKKHTISNTLKIVSGQNRAALDEIAKAYASVIPVGVYKVSSIGVAEAVKVIENTQRDLNISLINEIALILHRLNIDTHEVLQAAATKWNFLSFSPGLVGGHCISVDPYYLTYRAEQVGYHPDVILAGRRVNDLMGKFIAETAIKEMIKIGIPIKGARVGVFGLTFKENCPDLRNTKVMDMIAELRSYGVKLAVHDPLASSAEVKNSCGLHLTAWKDLKKFDVMIFAVSHSEYTKLDKSFFQKMLNLPGLVMDVKRMLKPKDFVGKGIYFWRL